MEKEQLDLIIRAAEVLQKKKELYDYVVIVLPVVTAFIGWFASAWWQSHTFVKNTKKEHYYTARDKVELIVEGFHGFLEYVYTSYKQMKNDANLMKILDEDTFYDFITEYQFKLGSLHQKLKIVFPGKLFPIKNITDEMKLLEGSILEMGSEIVKAVIEPNPDILSINKRIEELNKKNSTIIEKVTKEVAAIENTIIEILNRKAHELGIKE
jgi:hypothetical protein